MTRRNHRQELTVLALGIAAALCVPQAAAQQQAVARLKGVSGNVLVSGEAGLATGAESQRITNGARIITTANSGAIVVFDNGCEVTLKENERLEVDSNKPCALMLAEALAPGPVAAVGPSLLPLLLPAAGGAAAAAGGGGGTPTPVSPN